MKKSALKLSFIASFLVFMMGATNLFAQEGTITVGPGLVYGSEIENLGINVDGYYTINEQFRAGIGLIYFFPDSQNGFDFNWFDFNINGQYVFYSEDNLNAYGLAGINIAFLKVEAGGNSNSESEAGLNLGAGVEFVQDFGNIFGEVRLAGLGGDADQFVLGGGVRIPIN